jgi:hypothetical protein
MDVKTEIREPREEPKVVTCDASSLSLSRNLDHPQNFFFFIPKKKINSSAKKFI